MTDVLRCIDATGGIGYILTSDNKDPKGSFSTYYYSRVVAYIVHCCRGFDWESIIDNKISELIENIRIYQTNLGQKLVVSDPKTHYFMSAVDDTSCIRCLCLQIWQRTVWSRLVARD